MFVRYNAKVNCLNINLATIEKAKNKEIISATEAFSHISQRLKDLRKNLSPERFSEITTSLKGLEEDVYAFYEEVRPIVRKATFTSKLKSKFKSGASKSVAPISDFDHLTDAKNKIDKNIVKLKNCVENYPKIQEQAQRKAEELAYIDLQETGKSLMNANARLCMEFDYSNSMPVSLQETQLGFLIKIFHVLNADYKQAQKIDLVFQSFVRFISPKDKRFKETASHIQQCCKDHLLMLFSEALPRNQKLMPGGKFQKNTRNLTSAVVKNRQHFKEILSGKKIEKNSEERQIIIDFVKKCVINTVFEPKNLRMQLNQKNDFEFVNEIIKIVNPMLAIADNGLGALALKAAVKPMINKMLSKMEEMWLGQVNKKLNLVENSYRLLVEKTLADKKNSMNSNHSNIVENSNKGLIDQENLLMDLYCAKTSNEFQRDEFIHLTIRALKKILSVSIDAEVFTPTLRSFLDVIKVMSNFEIKLKQEHEAASKEENALVVSKMKTLLALQSELYDKKHVLDNKTHGKNIVEKSVLEEMEKLDMEIVSLANEISDLGQKLQLSPMDWRESQACKDFLIDIEKISSDMIRKLPKLIRHLKKDKSNFGKIVFEFIDILLSNPAPIERVKRKQLDSEDPKAIQLLDEDVLVHLFDRLESAFEELDLNK